MLEVSRQIVINDDELELQAVRAQGAGGQIQRDVVARRVTRVGATS